MSTQTGKTVAIEIYKQLGAQRNLSKYLTRREFSLYGNAE